MGAGFSVRNLGGKWIVDTPDGTLEIEFVERNPFGVLDHTVTLPSAVKILNSMRVIANGSGSDVIFTLLQAQNRSDELFLADAALVESDLQTLKRVLEA